MLTSQKLKKSLISTIRSKLTEFDKTTEVCINLAKNLSTFIIAFNEILDYKILHHYNIIK